MHRRSDDDEDDDDNNNVVQGLQAKLFLVFCITKEKKEELVFIFFFVNIHQIEEKGQAGRKYRHMCVCVYTCISCSM